MAIEFVDSTDYLTRSGAYLNSAIDFEVDLWIRNGATTPASGHFRWHWFWSAAPDGSLPYIYVGSNDGADDIYLEVFDGTTFFDSPSSFIMPASTFEAIAVTYQASTHTLSLIANGIVITSVVVDLSVIAFGSPTEYLNNPNSIGDWSAEYVRVRQAILTPMQRAGEFQSITPGVTAGLLANARLAASDVVTDTQPGRNWTEIGATYGYTDGPLPPANTTPGTALDISSLIPYTVTLDIQDAPKGTGHPNSGSPSGEWNEVWFKITANLNLLALAEQISAVPAVNTGNYAPAIQWWTGPIGSLVALAGTVADTLGALIYPQVAFDNGQTYYLQVVNSGGTNATFEPLFLNAQRPDLAPWNVGDVIIWSVNPHTPAIVFNQATGAYLKEFGSPLTFDVARLTKFAMLQVLDPVSSHVINWTILQLAPWGPLGVIAVITSILPGTTFLSPISQTATLFYVSVRPSGAPAIVYTITPAGVVGGMTWTLPDPTSRNIYGMGVNGAGVLLYWVENIAARAVHVFNLFTNLPAADFLAGAANVAYGPDVLIDASGNILLMASTTNPGTPPVTWVVRRYAPGGALLDTYPVGNSVASNAPRMALALDGQSIWTNIEFASPPVFGTFRLSQIRLSDGVVLNTWTIVKKEGDNLTHNQRFGAGESAPPMPLPLTSGGGGGGGGGGFPPGVQSCPNCWNEDGDFEVN